MGMEEFMTEEKKRKRKSDEEVIFAQEKVAGFIVKPWSFGVLFEISEMLDSIFTKLDQRGVDLKFDFNDGLGADLSRFIRIAAIAAPEVKAILAITIDADENTIEELDMKTGIKLLTTVFKQNFEIIKNGLGLSLIKEEEKEKVKEKKEEEGISNIQTISQ